MLAGSGQDSGICPSTRLFARVRNSVDAGSAHPPGGMLPTRPTPSRSLQTGQFAVYVRAARCGKRRSQCLQQREAALAADTMDDDGGRCRIAV